MQGVKKIIDSKGLEVEKCEKGGEYELFTEYQNITAPVQKRYDGLAALGGFAVRLHPANAHKTKNSPATLAGKSESNAKRTGPRKATQASPADMEQSLAPITPAGFN